MQYITFKAQDEKTGDVIQSFEVNSALSESLNSRNLNDKLIATKIAISASNIRYAKMEMEIAFRNYNIGTGLLVVIDFHSTLDNGFRKSKRLLPYVDRQQGYENIDSVLNWTSLVFQVTTAIYLLYL